MTMSTQVKTNLNFGLLLLHFPNPKTNRATEETSEAQSDVLLTRPDVAGVGGHVDGMNDVVVVAAVAAVFVVDDAPVFLLQLRTIR